MNNLENQNSIFPKDEKASADYFTSSAAFNNCTVIKAEV
jgi:hypothetical protein